MKPIETVWRVDTYDVWGNRKDGYDVNDVYRQGEVTLKLKPITYNVGQPGQFDSAYPSDYQICRVFGVGCAIETDGDDLHIEVRRRSDGYPIGRLTCQSHASLSPIRLLPVAV